MMLGHHERASRVKTYSHDLLSDIRLSPGIHVAKIRWWLGWQVDDFLYINSPSPAVSFAWEAAFHAREAVCKWASMRGRMTGYMTYDIIWHHMTSYDIYVHLEVIWCWLVGSSNCCLSSWVTAWKCWICSPLCLFGWFFARLKISLRWDIVGKDVAFLDANTCQLNDIKSVITSYYYITCSPWGWLKYLPKSERKKKKNPESPRWIMIHEHVTVCLKYLGIPKPQYFINFIRQFLRQFLLIYPNHLQSSPLTSSSLGPSWNEAIFRSVALWAAGSLALRLGKSLHYRWGMDQIWWQVFHGLVLSSLTADKKSLQLG